MPASGWLAVGAVLGALGGSVLPGPALLLATGGVSLGAIVLRRERRTGVGPLASALGAILVLLRLIALPAPPVPVVAIPEGRGPWLATVVAMAPVRAGSQVATLRLDEPAGLLISATLPRYPEIEPGSAITVDGAIRAPAAGAYADYLTKTGIAGTLQARRLEIRSPASEAGFFERVRRAAADALTRAIPQPEAGLAAGIVVGLRDRVDRSLSADFTTVGASHIVAISGWNIAIVAATVAALAGRLARRRRAILTAMAIVLYVAVAGGSPSVVRAAAMAGVILLARESGRAGRAAAALGWATTILLLVDPRIVGDAGFQLSGLATAGIVAWATPLTDRFGRGAGRRLPSWLTECLAVSLAAQAATLPVVLLTFGRLPVVSPVVNLLIVPLVAPAMAACGVALAGGLLAMAGAPGAVATVVGLPAWFLLSLIVGAVQAAAGLPFASLTLGPPWNLAAAALAAAIPAGIAVLLRRRRGDRSRLPTRPSTEARPVERPTQARSARPSRATRVVAVVLGGSLAALVLVAAHRPDGATRISVLDVGQGDAILVEGSRGGRLLVDGGPDPDRLLIALDHELPPWDRRIDTLVLTHPHEDHVAGLALLLSRYRVGHVYEGGMRGPGPGYAAWAAALKGAGAPQRGTLSTGDRLAVDDLRFRVLWPDPGRVPSEPPDAGRGINDVSIVLLGEVDGRRLLLTGDVEDDVDPLLASRGLPSVDFLKVAHHGSKTASTPAFLDMVRPAVAVVSAGAGNPYGHPARSTIDRLVATGARVYRTDTDGSVEVVISGGRMSVRAAGARAAGASAPSRTIGAPTGSPVLARFAFSCAVPSSG